MPIIERYRDIDLPIIRPLIALRGDTLESDPNYHKDPDGVTPIDLTGYTITAKGGLADGTAIDLTDYLVIDRTGGSYYLSIPPTVSNGATPWPVGLGSYDITLTDTLGKVLTYWAGPLGLKEGAHV